jgi:ElaB/YqjD/DUF883 family membrane-anchored ribosome-binding protein
MILYRLKYYAQPAEEIVETEINLYNAFKKAYDSSTNHPQWVEKLKKRSDKYIAEFKSNPSNNRFSDWLIELSPSGMKAAEDYLRSSNALINDYIENNLSEEDWNNIKKSFDKLFRKANGDDKERLEYLFGSDFRSGDFVKILNRLEGVGGEGGVGNIYFDKIPDHDLKEFRDLIGEAVEEARGKIKNQLSTVEYKDTLKNREKIVRNILENDPISSNTENIPSSFEFRGKKVSLSEAEMGRYMKMQEVFEENFKGAISKKNGMKKFLDNIFSLFGGSDGKVKQIKDSILEECKKTNDPEQMLKILSDKFNLKNKEELFLRTIQELSSLNKCDSLKDFLTKITSNPKLAKDIGLSSKNINELKKVLDDNVAKSFVKKLTMVDPKTLENAVINLKLTEEEINRSKQYNSMINGNKPQPSTNAEKEIVEDVEDAVRNEVVKDTKTGEVKTSLWKKATKWVKENPWKSTAIGVGALSIGFAVHQCLKKKDEIREERNRAKFDRWKNKFE